MDNEALTKKRKFGWHFSVDKEDKTGSISKKGATRKVHLTKNDEKFALSEINSHLDHSLIPLLIYKLKYHKQQGKLFEIIKLNEFKLFDRALKEKKIPVINCLLENLTNKQCFIMLSYRNFTALKEFTQTIKKLDWHIDIENILASILKVIPNWQTIEAIESSLSDQTSLSNAETIQKLQNYLDRVKKENIEEYNLIYIYNLS